MIDFIETVAVFLMLVGVFTVIKYFEDDAKSKEQADMQKQHLKYLEEDAKAKRKNDKP